MVQSYYDFTMIWRVLFLTSVVASCYAAPSPTRKKLLLVSFDGFRFDYFDHYDLTTFRKVQEEGTWAKDGVIPVFVTKTFPNHYTIVTGLYEESHGMVENKMFDPVFNYTFTMQNREDPRWWEDAEPLWITAMKHKLKTGTFFWPGSEVPIHGLRPNISRPYDGNVPYETRIDKVTGWLAHGSVDFATLYFEEPDKSAHKYGVFAPQMNQVMENVDNTLKLLLDKIREKRLEDKVNIVIVSDHGMTNYTNGNRILLNQYIDVKNDALVLTSGCTAGIIPKPGKLRKVYSALVDAHPNMRVYLKEEIPSKYHYSKHRRIPPVLAVADEGYQIVRNSGERPVIGQHGYNNFIDSMKSLFIGYGPAFRKKHLIETFAIVDIYPLLCELLGITPQPHNGTMKIVQQGLVGY